MEHLADFFLKGEAAEEILDAPVQFKFGIEEYGMGLHGKGISKRDDPLAVQKRLRARELQREGAERPVADRANNWRWALQYKPRYALIIDLRRRPAPAR
jgi:hypothetical protein